MKHYDLIKAFNTSTSDKNHKITKIATKLYGLFKESYIFYLETGYIDFEKS